MFLKKYFYDRNGLWIYSFVLIVINILLTQFPLTSTFGYEFAAVNGLLFVVLSGLQTLNLFKKSEYVIAKLIKNLFILFVIPFLIIIVHSLLTMYCSFWDGLNFYILIVGTSILFGTAIAFIVNLFTRRFKRVLFFLIIFFTALIPILEIYFNPQVYFYSPLIGFFPGNIYDEGLSADWKLVFHQLVVAVFSISIIFLYLKKTSIILKQKNYFIASIIIVAALFQLFSSSVGYSTTFSKLNSVLANQIESESLVLHYDDIDSTEAKFIALNQQYYLNELQVQLETKPSKKINVYLFNNREQKKILFGAGNADVAKPWQYSIYISADSWQNTLKHELAHIFTAEFGSGIFKIASGFNAALIEGMAESQDGISDNIPIEYLTKLAYNNGYVVDVKSLFTGLSFFKGNSTLAYIYSGAFIEFLIKKYGIEKVKQFYGNSDFENVFKNKIETVQKDFERSLIDEDLSNSKLMADYYFGRLSIIQKICPRFVGDRLRKAFQYLAENNLDEAENLFKEINKKTLNYSALFGLTEIYIKQNKLPNAIDLLSNNLKKFEGTPYFSNLYFRLGDIYALSNDNTKSELCYKTLIDENPNFSLVSLSNLRLSLLEKNILKDYLNEDDSTKYSLLRQLNDSSYNFSSIPVLISLSNELKINYANFIKGFKKTFIVDNLESSYAAFKLSEYMLEN
ncbi:MAG: hypothetical protein ABI638_02285, partial [Ignavibacteriota bacterium]